MKTFYIISIFLLGIILLYFLAKILIGIIKEIYFFILLFTPTYYFYYLKWKEGKNNIINKIEAYFDVILWE